MSPAYPQTLPVLRAEASPIAVLRDLTRMLLLLLVFTIPWEDQFVIGGLWTVSRIVGIATFAVGMLAVIADGRLRVPRPIHLVLGIFAVWIGLTAFWSINLDFTIYVLQTWAQLIALLWVIFEFAPARGDQIGLLRAYVLGTCVSAVGTLISYAQESSAYWERSVARGFDPNEREVDLSVACTMTSLT